MFAKYKTASRLSKAFVWLSLVVGGVFVATFTQQLTSNLALDPRSGTCLHDSMMQPICQHPWSSSVEWTFMIMVVLGWPLLLAWVIVGLMARRIKSRKDRSDKDQT